MRRYKLTRRSRRGSALLVVLGMLSFMIISAVAFSAWMRASRLPNSFLRRAASSRQLVKAALAAAIDEIDVAVGNNPHPGIGSRNYSFREDGRVRGTGTSGNRNLWLGRVFIGKKDGNSSDTARDHLLDPSKTVSTLSLEGLAYIPTPFVSEARYYSRRSNAAAWHDLAFDAGRYAFTAIDVSDCLDVNRLAANVGRSSSPYGRISLAHLFESSDHRSYAQDPKTWDDFMKQTFRQKSLAEVEVANGEASGKDITSASLVPVTSVADLNLALYDKGGAAGIGGLESPFSKYVEQGGASFYSGSLPDSARGQILSGMAFVADSWLPAGTVSTPGDCDQPQLDLAVEANQPFPSTELNKDNKTTAMAAAERYQSGTATVGQRLFKRLSGMGMALLHDYLDEDNVPISLGLPQVERAPMVAGIRHEIQGGTVAITSATEPQGANEQDDNYPDIVAGGGQNSTTRKIRKTVTYKLDPTQFVNGLDNGLQALLVYPFRNGRDVSDPDSFTVDGHIDVFFSSERMQLRTGTVDVFHDGNWGTEAGFAQSGCGNGFFRIGLQSRPATFSNVTDEQSAMRLVSFAGANVSPIVAQLNGAGFLFKVTWEVEQKRTIDPTTGAKSAWTKQGDWERTAAECGLPPLNASGVVDPAFATPGAVLNYLNGAHNKTATLHLSLSVRVKNRDGRTVDLAPAGLLDDRNFNNINNLGAMEEMGNIISGRKGPMLLVNGCEFALGDTEYDSNSGAQPFNFAPKGMVCADPRWNWAPEHWFQLDAFTDAQTWRSNCQVGQEGRDRDIFMMSGDARYLQSVYELACLPRLTTLENYGTDQLRGNMDNLMGSSFYAIPANFTDTMNRHLMWKTYNPYYRRGVDGFEVHPNGSTNARRDPFDLLNLVNHGNGFRLNPFSDSTNVTVAAFANSPTDWWTAGLDPEGVAGVDDSTRQNAKQFNQKHVFNEINTRAQFAWKDIKRIASNFIFCLHDNRTAREAYEIIEGGDGVDMVWQEAFDNCIDWSGDCTPGHESSYNDYFGTVISGTVDATLDGYRTEQLDGNTGDLYDVDRKFLYGYWRECFSAKQQLFLVFVRAEPLMMGGGAVGAVPPQLGARAVALVWRDPAPARGHENDIRYPHRTRVLFYRQLD